MSPIGKIVFALLGLIYFGKVGSAAVGFCVGLIIGHLCVDENEIIKKFVAKHPYLRKALSAFSKIRVKIPPEIINAFTMNRHYNGNPFDTAANMQEARDICFVQSLASLIACMSEADFGSLLYQKEKEIFLNSFVAPPYMIRQLGEIFERARKNKTGFEGYARQIGIMLTDNPLVKNDIIRLMFRIANLNGKISSAELNYLRKVSDLFGLPNSVFAKISNEFDKADDGASSYSYDGTQAPSIGKDPYKIIGVDRNSSDEEIKKVYRNLIRANHPDTLMAQGASKEEVEAANRFMAEVNSAYDMIEKERQRK